MLQPICVAALELGEDALVRLTKPAYKFAQLLLLKLPNYARLGAETLRFGLESLRIRRETRHIRLETFCIGLEFLCKTTCFVLDLL